MLLRKNTLVFLIHSIWYAFGMFSKNSFRKQWHDMIIDTTNLTLEKMFIAMHLHLYL